MIADLAPQYRGKITFVTSGLTWELEEKLAEFVGLTEKDLPTFRIHDIKWGDIRKYSLTKEINSVNIQEFLNEFLEWKL